MDDPTEAYGQEFDSGAEWFGARYKLRGAKALRETLNGLVAIDQCHRELFWIPAAELMAQGMSKPAIMVRNAGRKCASLTDLNKFWPYSCEPDPVSIRAATASAERRVAKYRQKAELLLRQVGLGLDWLGEEEISGPLQGGGLSAEGGKSL